MRSAKGGFPRAGYRIDPSDNQMKGARFSFLDVIALLNGFGLVIE